jgi:hypothetical protein
MLICRMRDFLRYPPNSRSSSGTFCDATRCAIVLLDVSHCIAHPAARRLTEGTARPCAAYLRPQCKPPERARDTDIDRYAKAEFFDGLWHREPGPPSVVPLIAKPLPSFPCTLSALRHHSTSPISTGNWSPRAVSARSVQRHAKSRQLPRRVPNLYQLARLKPITSPARIWQPPCFMTPQNPD